MDLYSRRCLATPPEAGQPAAPSRRLARRPRRARRLRRVRTPVRADRATSWVRQQPQAHRRAASTIVRRRRRSSSGRFSAHVLFRPRPRGAGRKPWVTRSASPRMHARNGSQPIRNGSPCVQQCPAMSSAGQDKLQACSSNYFLGWSRSRNARLACVAISRTRALSTPRSSMRCLDPCSTPIIRTVHPM